MKKFALLFSFILIIFAAMFSCADDGDSNPSGIDGGSPDAQGEAEAGPAESNILTDDLPELDFGGYGYRVVVGTYNLRNEELYPEAENGDILNDTIYQRNKTIEERFNIALNSTTINLFELLSSLRKNVKAGDDSYDMYMQIDREAHVAAAEHLLYRVEELPYIDLDRPYWCGVANEQLSINGKLYWAFSDDMLSFLEATVVTFFNKKQVMDLGLEDIYKLVRTGSWTHDKFFEYAKTAVKDIDGDGKMTAADNWGILSEHYYIAQSFWVSSGIRLIEKDGDDLPYFAIPGNQAFFDIADRAIAGLNFAAGVFLETIEDKTKALAPYPGDSAMAKRLEHFRNGYCLFSVGAIPEMIDLRDMPDDFGIVPFPKFTLEQKQYYSSVCGGFPFVIPSTNQRPEIAGAVMEAMACAARNKIIPAYYESALKTKYSRDADTAEMLDIIFDSRVYDLGATIWPAPGTDYTYAFIKDTNTFASVTEKNADRYGDIMKKAIESIIDEK